MTRKYWEGNIFPQFLSSITECTLSGMLFIDIQSVLNDLAIKAISRFKFPKNSIEYGLDLELNSETDIPYGYFFTSDAIGQAEFNVIVSRMKQLWVEHQISQERLLMNPYFDKNISFHSPGNTIDKLIKLLKTFEKFADDIEYDYNRVNPEGSPTLGDINGE